MSDAVLEALWKKVVDSWDDDAVHAAFIEHCQATEQLLEAAVRYRGMSGDHARGVVARKRLEAIALLAMTKLEAERTEPSRDFAPIVRLALIVFFLGGSIALLFAMRR